MKKHFPWYSKIVLKLILSRLPFDYRFWKKIGLFEHGHMESITYCFNVFKQHFELVKPRAGFVSLELGPGDSLLSAIVSKAFGGSESFLVDSKDFVDKEEVRLYKDMAEFLDEQGFSVPSIEHSKSLSDILDIYSTRYMTSGLLSLKEIPSQSIDFIWSQAVLEHIRRDQFLDTCKELRRIVKNDGVCSHEVDLRDHLGGALNNLRFSARLWESDFMASSGFYTNRIQFLEMLSLFEQANFEVEVVNVNRWSELPTDRNNLAKQFSDLSDDELTVSVFSVILKPV